MKQRVQNYSQIYGQMTTVPKKSNGVSTVISTNGASTASSKRKTSKKKKKKRKTSVLQTIPSGSKKIIYGIEKMFVNHISNKGLASENIKNSYSSIILKWAKTGTSLVVQ